MILSLELYYHDTPRQQAYIFGCLYVSVCVCVCMRVLVCAVWRHAKWRRLDDQ